MRANTFPHVIEVASVDDLKTVHIAELDLGTRAYVVSLDQNFYLVENPLLVPDNVNVVQSVAQAMILPSTHVRLTDCEYEVVRFSRTFNSIAEMSDGGDLLADGALDYLFDAHTYVISMTLVTDQPLDGITNPSVRYLQPTLSGAGFDDYIWQLFNHNGDSAATEPPDPVLYRVFPGQSLAIKIFMSGDVAETFPRTETVEVLIAKTNYTVTTEA